MTTLKHAAIVATLLLTLSTSFAQSALESPYYNRAILRYYSPTTLMALEQNDASKLEMLMYYFNQSYDVRLIACPECAIDYDVLLNQEVFNIVNFEHLRLPTEEVRFSFKESVYEIILHPVNLVQSNLGAIPLAAILTQQASNPLPEWISTGDNDLDYATYKRALTTWAVKHPEKYRELTNGTGLIKIQITEFLNLPDDKRTALSSNAQGYIIID